MKIITENPKLQGAILALIAALGFSMKSIFVKLAYPYGVDAITLLTLRMGMSLPVFLWIGLAAQSKSSAKLTSGDIWKLIILGCLGYYVSSIFDFWGLVYISAGLERLILFTYPTLTILIGVFFQGKSFSKQEALAIALCYTGIGFAFIHDLGQGNAEHVWIGSALILGASITYAIYLSGSATMIMRLGAMRFASLATLISVTMTVAHYLLEHPLSDLIQPWPVYLWAGAMAIFSTIVPVLALSAAIRRIGAGQSALFGMIGPILTIILGWWLLEEPLSFMQGIGAVLVILGILVVSRK